MSLGLPVFFLWLAIKATNAPAKQKHKTVLTRQGTTAIRTTAAITTTRTVITTINSW